MRRRNRGLLELAAIGLASAMLLTWLGGRAPHVDLPPATPGGPLPVATGCDDPRPADRPPLVSSAAVVECPQRFDRRTVIVVGEVVGDVIRRANGAWVQINDDDYALKVGPLPLSGHQAGTNSGIAVWLPDPLADGLLAGRSHQRGTVLRVVGTFLRADPQDGGGTTVRAEEREVLAEGHVVSRTVGPVVAIASLIPLVVAGVLWRRRLIAR